MFLLGKIHVLPDCPMAALELKYPPREIHIRNYFFIYYFKNCFTSKFDIEELNREETLRVNSIKINFITFKEKKKKERLASAATDVRIKREREEPHGRHAGCLDNQQLLFKKKSLLTRMIWIIFLKTIYFKNKWINNYLLLAQDPVLACWRGWRNLSWSTSVELPSAPAPLDPPKQWLCPAKKKNMIRFIRALTYSRDNII